MNSRKAAGARVKLSVTVDPSALDAIDRYIATHTGTDRSKLVDEALTLWVAAEQQRAIRRQYEPLADQDERVLREERAAWNAIRHAAAERALGTDGE